MPFNALHVHPHICKQEGKEFSPLLSCQFPLFRPNLWSSKNSNQKPARSMRVLLHSLASPSHLLRKAFLSYFCSTTVWKDTYLSKGLQIKVFHLLNGAQLLVFTRSNGEGLNACSLPAADLQILRVYNPKSKQAFKWVPDLNNHILTLLRILKEDNKVLSALKQLHSPAKFSD